MHPGLPFAHLNLRRNPFGEQDREAWVQTAVLDVDPLVAWLREPGSAVQLVAAPGRGKTTCLLALDAALPEATYARAWTESVPARRRAILLLDEADAIWFFTRWPLLLTARSVAVAVHRDFSRELRLLGFRVHTKRPGGLDAERLHTIVTRRVEAVRRGPGPVPRVPHESLHALIAEHGDDLRAVRVALYAAFQRLETVRDVDL